jgi:TPR repeat protein
MMVVAAALLALVSCSTTPGDAANRSHHPRQAAELYRQGAEQGDAVAALKLGFLIEDDASLITDFGMPGRWFVRSCEIGDDAGCHNAGIGFEYGKNGLTKNYEQARDYYQKAAMRGYMQSQYNLGSLYSNLYFQDDVTGLMWLLAAQDNARTCIAKPLCKWILDDPPGHVAKLKGRMSPEDIATAEGESKKVSKSRAEEGR